MHARHETKDSKYLPKDYNNIKKFFGEASHLSEAHKVDPPTRRPELVIETTGNSNLDSGIYRNFTS